jgi:hypothetical protein
MEIAQLLPVLSKSANGFLTNDNSNAKGLTK